MQTWGYHVIEAGARDTPFDILIEAPTESDALWTLYRTVHGFGCKRVAGPVAARANAVHVSWEQAMGQMNSTYGWIIDSEAAPADQLPSRAGLTGPGNLSPEIQSQLAAGAGAKFRMLGADGDVCFEGRYIGPDDARQFGPLDDLGAPDAGCTSIEYMVDGRWTPL